MNKLFLGLMAASAFFCSASAAIENPDSTGFKFTDVKVVKSTSMKNQAKSGTCWCFSGNSFLEDEILRITGKEYDLSEMFIVRMCYLDKADKYIRTNGHVNYNQGGSLLDNPYVWSKYGMMPEEAYKGLNYGETNHNHYEMCEGIIGYLNAVNKKPGRKLTTAWLNGVAGILDAYFGQVPETFTYEGKTYTPKTFAQSLGLDMNNYIAFTSFSHHPFNKPFGLEVADNWLWGQYTNVTLEDFKAIVDYAVENGYPVGWAADVSEGGFKWNKGYAVIPEETKESDLEGSELARWVKLSAKEKESKRFDIKGPVKEITVTQESRQKMFDSQETTDDHGMVIEGYAVDQNGKRYYKVKNSWDDKQIYKGYFYVSEAYFMAKTLSIMVHKDAVPKSVLKKL
ncbi:MAG: C1 family peptidase [Bacteroidales bacterium]|nr:C1 family peptidase [Bacteroidales bacterium]